MERRDFLSGAMGVAGVAGAAAAAVMPSIADAQNLPSLNWRLASSFPKSLDTIFGGAEQFARIIDGLTGGKFKITIVDNATSRLQKTRSKRCKRARLNARIRRATTSSLSTKRWRLTPRCRSE